MKEYIMYHVFDSGNAEDEKDFVEKRAIDGMANLPSLQAWVFEFDSRDIGEPRIIAR